MQEVDLTPKLLLEFSLAFAKIPNVEIQGGQGIPFELGVLASWLTELAETGHSNMFAIFQAYLCGKEQFLHPDTEWEPKELLMLLANTVKGAMENG